MTSRPTRRPSVEVADDVVMGDGGAIPIRRYRPTRRSDVGAVPPTLLWFHGGGFFRGDLALPEAHEVAFAVAEHGIPVVSADYRLVPAPGWGWARRPGRPSVRFPLPRRDVLDVMRHVSRETASSYVVGGASAGACLVASAITEAVGSGAGPRAAVLAYGFFHARHPVAPAIQRGVRGRRRLTHSRWALDLANRNYAGSAAALDDPRAFPGGGDLRGFPPTLMIDAERDAMRASAEEFARELLDAGIPLERHVLTGAGHAFLNRPGEASFTIGIAAMVEWIRSMTT